MGQGISKSTVYICKVQNDYPPNIENDAMLVEGKMKALYQNVYRLPPPPQFIPVVIPFSSEECPTMVGPPWCQTACHFEQYQNFAGQRVFIPLPCQRGFIVMTDQKEVSGVEGQPGTFYSLRKLELEEIVSIIGPLPHIAEPILKLLKCTSKEMVAVNSKYNETIRKQKQSMDIQTKHIQETEKRLANTMQKVKKLEDKESTAFYANKKLQTELKTLREEHDLLLSKETTVQEDHKESLKCLNDHNTVLSSRIGVLTQQVVEQIGRNRILEDEKNRTKIMAEETLNETMNEKTTALKDLEKRLNTEINKVHTMEKKLKKVESALAALKQTKATQLNEANKKKNKLTTALHKEEKYRKEVEEKYRHFKLNYEGIKILYEKVLKKNLGVEEEVLNWVKISGFTCKEDMSCVDIIREMRVSMSGVLHTINEIRTNSLNANRLEQLSVLFSMQNGLSWFNLHLYMAYVAHNTKTECHKMATQVQYYKQQCSILHESSRALRVRLDKPCMGQPSLDLSSHELPNNTRSIIAHIETSPPSDKEFNDYMDEVVSKYTISPHTVTYQLFVTAETLLAVVRIQRWVRRWWSQTKHEDKPFYITFFNYKHHTVNYLVESVIMSASLELKQETIVSGTPLRLKKLIKDCPGVVKDIDAFLNDTNPNSSKAKLKGLLQDALEERMALFMHTYLKKFPSDWQERIVCGVFVTKGDVDTLNDFLYSWYKKGDICRRSVPLRLMTEWGLSELECGRLLHRYCAVQHILGTTAVTISEDNKKITMRLPMIDAFHREVFIPQKYQEFCEKKESSLDTFD